VPFAVVAAVLLVREVALSTQNGEERLATEQPTR
jgi:hypothetical protein